MEHRDFHELLKENYEYEQQREARMERVPCAECGKPVYTKDVPEWEGRPELDRVSVHPEDGRHFHTDCYQLHLIKQHGHYREERRPHT